MKIETANNSIACQRLFNQRLAGNGFAAPREVVAWMGAMQAQDFNMARWAVGIRMRSCTDKTVAEALNRGEIIRTHVMRPTWHFVAPENIRWMLQLTAPRIASSMKSRDAELGVTGEFCAAAFRIVEKALEGGRHLTREELTAVMKQNRIKVDSARMYHLLMHAELAGLTCSGAIRGKEHTYALLEERATEAVTLARDEALGRLAMTYFTGHGPATLHDFAWWSGLSAANARQGLESAKPALVSEKYGDRTYWTADASGNFIDGDNNPVRLLPAFDEYIIGYRDRSATLAEENHGKAISGNGIFRPVVIKHGQAIGIWKKNVSKSGTITANLFAPVDKTTQEQIGEAEKGFRRFTGQIAM